MVVVRYKGIAGEDLPFSKKALTRKGNLNDNELGQDRLDDNKQGSISV
jgi:hypothetical protein